MLALAPPKPNELLNAHSIRRACGEAINVNPQAASGVPSMGCGGSHWPCKAIRQATTSTAPAAPSRCPMAPLVELTAKDGPEAPAYAVIACASATSFAGVPVPWAFT